MSEEMEQLIEQLMGQLIEQLMNPFRKSRGCQTIKRRVVIAVGFGSKSR